MTCADFQIYGWQPKGSLSVSCVPIKEFDVSVLEGSSVGKAAPQMKDTPPLPMLPFQLGQRGGRGNL